MTILLVISLLITVTLLVYLQLLRTELRGIVQQLATIREQATNEELRLTSKNKGLVKLAQELNEFLRLNKKAYQQMQQNTEEFDVAIHNITHDLRTPLTVASGYSQYLIANPALTTVERQELTAKIASNLTNVEQRLESLLEYNRVSEQDITPQLTTVNLSQTLQEKCFSYYPSFQARGIDLALTIGEQIKLIADQEMVERIIENILGNVLKHGQEQAEISLEQREASVILSCSNQTAQEILDYDLLFKRFYTEDLAREHKNAGLGLYITKELVEVLGGKITLSGNKGRFYLEIIFSN